MNNCCFYLSSCDTCKRIIKETLTVEKGIEIIDIKKNPITETQLKELYALSGSYEALFNKRAQKFQALKDAIKSEDDFKKHLLAEYTFLKRPVYIIDGDIFIGNSKKNVANIQVKLDS